MKECRPGVQVPLIEAAEVQGVVAAATTDTVLNDKDPEMEVITSEIDLYRPFTR